MRHRLLGLAIGVVLLALLLRAWHGATRRGVWRDEANAYFVVKESLSLGELFRNIRVESSPPLGFLVEYAVQRIGGTDFSLLRSIGAVLGTLTVAGIVILGWRAFHPACGILSGLLVATSPYFIRMSCETRSYPLFAFLAVVHAGAYLRYLERRRLVDACLWGVSLAALAYTHYYAFPIGLCAVGAALAQRRTRTDALRVGAAVLLAGVLYAPWLPTLLLQVGADLQPWYVPRTGILNLRLLFDLPLGAPGAILLVAGLFGSVWVLRHREPAVDAGPERMRLWALLSISAFAAALALVMQTYVGAFEPRYLIGMGVALVPAACVYWSRMFLGERVRYPLPWRAEPLTIEGPTRRRLAWGFLAAAIVCQHVDHERWLRPSSPAREFAAFVEEHGRAEDLIWIFPAPYASSFNYHFRGPQAELAFPFRGRVTRIDWPALKEREQDPELIRGFLDDLGRQLERGGRVWVLLVERLPMDAGWPFGEGPSPPESSRLARAEIQVHRRALRVLYSKSRVAGWWDRPHADYHEGMTLILFDPSPDRKPYGGD